MAKTSASSRRLVTGRSPAHGATPTPVTVTFASMTGGAGTPNAMVDKMKRLAGAGFDTAYMSDMVADTHNPGPDQIVQSG